MFQQNVPGNAQYSHLNIINHELNEQQKQNYQNLIRNQQQIKEQQAVLQLANQLRVQNLQQSQPHYVSREPLLNTVSDSFVNNPYQPNIGNVNNISPVVPQYYQQLPSQRYYSENTAQSSAIQTEVNHDVRSPPLNRPILHNYNQWPKKQEVSVPGKLNPDPYYDNFIGNDVLQRILFLINHLLFCFRLRRASTIC